MFVLSLLCTTLLLLTSSVFVEAIAPLRSVGQPYAEAQKCAEAAVIFCEDFDYPENFFYSGAVENDNSDWINPGLTTGLLGGISGLEGRRLNPATDYPAQPSGSPPGGAVWVANWDPTKGAQGNGSTWGMLREPGGNYANGTLPAKDLYIRFQYYVTDNYAWPGDPRPDPYNYGASSPTDNKILFIYPPEGFASPNNAAYDAGLYTTSSVYDPIANARFADALAVRYGDAGDNYKFTPLCSSCTLTPQHNEYAPFQSLTLRNPNDHPVLLQIFRFNTNRWYTLEYRYKLSSAPGVSDGLIEVWIDGTQVYSVSGLATCGSGLYGDCSGIGAIDIVAYHNLTDATVWNGQQVIDNLIISRSYIGPPGMSTPINAQFATFSPKVEIDLGPSARDDKFEVKAPFSLGASNDGIKPPTEAVSLKMGTFPWTIPAGSFTFVPAKPAKKGKPGSPAYWKFEGTIGGASLEAKITQLGANSFEFKAEANGTDLTGTVNPVTVALTIGNDGGSTAVQAEFNGESGGDGQDGSGGDNHQGSGGDGQHGSGGDNHQGSGGDDHH